MPRQPPMSPHTEDPVPEEPQMSKFSRLAASLRGQTIRVPNLEPIFGGWPLNLVNPNYPMLKSFVYKKIENLGFTDRKLNRFQGADLALFVSCWWPKAELNVCQTIALWVIWLFVWDDEVEMEESSLNDTLAVDKFRKNTCLFIRHCLGVETSQSCPQPQSVIVRSFSEFSDRLCKYYDDEQLERFFNEAKFYFEMTQLEEEIKKKDELPTIDEFWRMRMGSSGTKPCIVLAEAAIGTKLPSRLMNHPDMEILWDQTAISIAISNDIFSLKKELRSNAVLSVIPVTYADCGEDIQSAVDRAIESLCSSVAKFNEAAERIMGQTVEGTTEHKALANYIQVLQTNQTGHHYWSPRSGRYLLEGAVREDGSLEITL